MHRDHQEGHEGRKRHRDDREWLRHQGDDTRGEYDPNIRIKQEKDDKNFERQQRDRSRNESKRHDNHRRREENGDFGLNSNAEPPHSEGNSEVKTENQPKERPNFETSGKLTEDTNTFRGVVIKYNEPPEAMIPKRRWRLYPFKGDTPLPVLHIHRQSAFLLGRERKIADIPIDHPSCSKQQAVLQFRAVNFTRDDGTTGRRVRPFIIDLESSNGTFLNSEKIDARRYYELKEKDVLKFGFSTREYVILHDKVDTSEVNNEEL